MQLPEISMDVWDRKYRFNGEPTPSDTFERVAKALGRDLDQSARFYEVMNNWEMLPAGRILAGAGTGRSVTLFNCFVMGTIPDSMAGIFTHLREAALTMQAGGGIGYDFSTLRPTGALVKGVGADASGPLSFMDVWDAMCKTVMSAGERRGAMMATMRCDHPDILQFIRAKVEPNRLRNFNLSVLCTDAFMDAVQEAGSWDLVFEGKVYATVDAQSLWAEIMQNTYDHAEPGVIFIDRINRENNLQAIETIAATNPCGEQPLPPYGACLLGSMLLPSFIVSPFTKRAGIDIQRLNKAVATAVEMLDRVIDVSRFPLREQEDEAKNKRRIGLGVTGLADALVMMGMRYGSEAAVNTTNLIMSTIANAAYVASANLAAELGPYPLYADAKPLAQKDAFINKLPSSTKALIKKTGLRNSHLLSVAPTGTMSLYAGNMSSGVEPIFAGEFTRKLTLKDGSREERVVRDLALEAWFMTPEGKAQDGACWPPGFATVADLSPADHLIMQATAQKWVDSSISKTINLPENITMTEFDMVYLEAYAMGCKGCTTYRPNEVTGSILSAEPTKPGELPMQAVGNGPNPFYVPPTDQEFTEIAVELDIPAMIDRIFEDDPATAGRNYVLDGRTYKIKLGNHATYVTLTDLATETGKRPYELFLSTKDPAHGAWMVALSRMVSAVFRRGHDSSFVAKELREVFDPAGGGWWDGVYYPSLVAAIGKVINDHMIHIGYIQPGSPKGQVAEATQEVQPTRYSGKLCPVCAEPTHPEGGCGYSHCG